MCELGISCLRRWATPMWDSGESKLALVGVRTISAPSARNTSTWTATKTSYNTDKHVKIAKPICIPYRHVQCIWKLANQKLIKKVSVDHWVMYFFNKNKDYKSCPNKQSARVLSPCSSSLAWRWCSDNLWQRMPAPGQYLACEKKHNCDVNNVRVRKLHMLCMYIILAMEATFQHDTCIYQYCQTWVRWWRHRVWCVRISRRLQPSSARCDPWRCHRRWKTRTWRLSMSTCTTHGVAWRHIISNH